MYDAQTVHGTSGEKPVLEGRGEESRRKVETVSKTESSKPTSKARRTVVGALVLQSHRTKDKRVCVLS